MNTYAFTDGASRGNPGPGGWGAVVVIDGEVKELGGREDNTTNNRMELTAIIEAIKHSEGPLKIYTDSGYALKGATSWIKNWKVNGWQTKEKGDVQNSDLWKELDKVMEGRELTWQQVGGHIGLPGNERADKIATAFADETPMDLYSGSKSEYGVDVDNVEIDEKLVEKKSRQGMKAYSYVTMVDGDIQTHQTWPEAEARVKGKPARYRKAISPEDEELIIKEFKGE